MSQYKFTYFDVRGLGEPIRLLLAFSGTPFEDIRFPMGSLKPPGMREELGSEWGQLPILEIDGEKKAQSWAIARYLAKKLGIAGKNEDEQFRCDEIIEATRDYMEKGRPMIAYYYHDREKLEQEKQTFAEVVCPVYLKRFNDLLEKEGKTWVVGDSFTYADIYVEHWATHFEILLEIPLTQNFPALRKHINAVQNHPKLKKWYAERPYTRS